MSENENFRDSISTVTEEGKRAWIYPKKPKGHYYKLRRILGYFLLLFLIVGPFIEIGGNQFLLFDVIGRRFHIFGVLFWPQDFYFFVICMVVGVVFVIIFTNAYGRIFCGWVCPQTIFMELVFRRVEYWIEGDRAKQMKLSRQPWNAEKIRKRSFKWSLFLVISSLISHVFLAYLIGSDTVLSYINQGPSANPKVFFALLIFTGVFYFIFTWFREQVCLIACPYGRLQGVLLDQNSIVVAYDHIRGEDANGRKKWRKNEDRKAMGHGDCIDCIQCVDVCPTGIDIRNGTQLECVNCTACIDACDTVMEKIGFEKGLIRYASENSILRRENLRFTPKMKVFGAVLMTLVVLVSIVAFYRNDIETHILRLPGQLYERKNDSIISNVFTYKIINKTPQQYDDVHFELKNYKGIIKRVSTRASFSIPEGGMSEGTLFIEINQSQLEGNNNTVIIEVYNGTQFLDHTKVNFLGPISSY